MNTQWITMKSEDDIQSIVEKSHSKPQLIFKHSTICPTSLMAHRNVDKVTDEVTENVDIHYVDVIEQRPISQAIAAHFQITHQSPQVLLIDKGEVTWDTSHTGIYANALLKQTEVKENA